MYRDSIVLLTGFPIIWLCGFAFNFDNKEMWHRLDRGMQAKQVAVHPNKNLGIAVCY
jgi:hypothetical protein